MVMRTSIRILMPICVALMWASLSIATDSIGSVVAITGQATVLGADGTSRNLQLKSQVFLNDKIVTGKGAKVQVMFDDDSVLSQGEASEMTLDNYVYSPNKKDSSCSLKLAKGVFRVITGKITELNPDRFKVRTKMATIGIRGCELGFSLRRDKEDIYILELPEGKSILIKKMIQDELVEPGIASRVRTLLVQNVGVAVTIQPDMELKERSITPAEANQIRKDVMPGKSAGGNGSRGGADSDSDIQAARDRAADALGKIMQMESQEDAQARANALPTKSPSSASTSPAQSSEPTTPPYTAPPVTAPPVMVAGHPTMDDWEWGLWADGTTYYSGNRYLGAAFLTANDVSALPSGYHLTGSGQAGAVVYLPSSGYRNSSLQGICSLEVQVGMSAAAPKWGGSFDLSGGGDSFAFTVDFVNGGGTINSDGSLALNNLATYSLTANQQSFPQNTLTSQRVNGNLIKPASGVPPISAVAGDFQFQHGSSATVNGAFGTNLK
jgi:hypothetical protein